MRVLITGHLGYIGPVMVRLFKEAGHHVTGLDIGYFRECITEDAAYVAPDKEIMRDVRDVQLHDLDNINAVVHLAALSNDPMGQLNEQLTYRINHQASVNLAVLAKKAGVERFIFASSCSIYGAAGNEAALDEHAAFNPVSAYAHSKVNSETDIQKLADASFSPVFMRNATAYGVSPRMRFDLVLNNLMAWAKTTGSVKVMSDGSPWRPLVHIEDISLAALSAAQAPRDTIHNQAFNVGRNDANYQVRDIAQAVATMVPGSKLEITGESGAGDTRSYRVSFDKALKTLPGFAPQWTLEKGCEEIRNWFDAGNLHRRAFDSRFFIRLEQLRHLIKTGSVDSELRIIQKIAF